MKKQVVSILLAALFPAGAAFDQSPRLLYGIEDPELNALGKMEPLRGSSQREALGCQLWRREVKATAG